MLISPEEFVELIHDLYEFILPELDEFHTEADKFYTKEEYFAMEFADTDYNNDNRGVNLMALSCNDVESHNGWINDIKAYNNLTEFSFPIIGDTKLDTAEKYRMMYLDEKDVKSIPLTCRAVFINNRNKKLKLSPLYPAATRRNFDEFIRVIDSLQLTANKKIATPVD